FCASKDDKQEINSNYGWCVFSEANGNQYENCLKKLQADPNSREAMLIYTRPSIHHDAVENGKHDFICTNYSHFFIRNNRLEMIHSQRSCDCVHGLSFDFPWSCFVYQMLYEELRHTYPDLKPGLIHYHIDSLHVYDRNENLLKKYIEENKI
ncbi:MAG: thymidylate synthase, partial [Succinivibrionaceae bacterium]